MISTQAECSLSLKMYYIIYSSYTSLGFNDEELRALLVKAREKNKKIGVTGMMLFFDGKFIQLIEGDEKTVKQLYETIFNDPRHDRNIILKQGTTENRFFFEWSMSFKSISPEELIAVDGYQDLKASGGINSSAAMRLFKILSQKND
jgi:hypothetical protein